MESWQRCMLSWQFNVHGDTCKKKVTPSCSWPAPSPGPGSGLPVDQHLSQSPDHLSAWPAVTTCSIKWLKTQGPWWPQVPGRLFRSVVGTDLGALSWCWGLILLALSGVYEIRIKNCGWNGHPDAPVTQACDLYSHVLTDMESRRFL